jgi:hypothetical protein
MWVSLKSERFLSVDKAESFADRLRQDTSGRFKDVWVHDDDDGFHQVFYKSFFFRVWQLKCKGKAVRSVFLPEWQYGVNRDFILYPHTIQHFG